MVDLFLRGSYRLFKKLGEKSKFGYQRTLRQQQSQAVRIFTDLLDNSQTVRIFTNLLERNEQTLLIKNLVTGDVATLQKLQKKEGLRFS